MFNISKIGFLNLLSIYLILIFNCFLISCKDKIRGYVVEIEGSAGIVDTVKSCNLNNDTISEIKQKSDIEIYLESIGLVDVSKLNSEIIVDLRYSTTNNFLKTDLYKDFDKAFLTNDVAEMLVKAQLLLKDTFPEYNLIVFDATRPVDVQKQMWDVINVPEKDKGKYLSNPKYGSLHNFGAAVDVSIVDENNIELDMGTEYDSFEELAYPIMEQTMLKLGKLTIEQINNRKLLRRVMYRAGFFNIQTEWWHFNACYRKEARKKYKLIASFEIPKQDIQIAQNNFENTTDIISFKVQILATKQKLSEKDKRFLGLKVYRYFHKGLYKYTSGEFNSVEEAFDFKNKILLQGIPEAFIVAFYKGERITIKEAVELLN